MTDSRFWRPFASISYKCFKIQKGFPEAPGNPPQYAPAAVCLTSVIVEVFVLQSLRDTWLVLLWVASLAPGGFVCTRVDWL